MKRKWQIIKKVFKTTDCILIYEDPAAGTQFLHYGGGLIYQKLYDRLIKFVKNWKAQWNSMSQVHEKTDEEILEENNSQ